MNVRPDIDPVYQNSTRLQTHNSSRRPRESSSARPSFLGPPDVPSWAQCPAIMESVFLVPSLVSEGVVTCCLCQSLCGKAFCPFLLTPSCLPLPSGCEPVRAGCLCSRTRASRAERVLKLGSRGHDTQLSVEREIAAEEEAVVKRPCLKQSTEQKTRVRAWSAQSATRPTSITRLSCPTKENCMFGKPNTR